jgi:hypothetical protein
MPVPPLANELAVGASSLEDDKTLFRSPVPVPTTFLDPVLPTSAPLPILLFVPMLLLVPNDDALDPKPTPDPALLLVATEERVPIDDDAVGPVIELFRLPARELLLIELPTLLLLAETGGAEPANDGMGDLAREDEIADDGPSFSFVLSLFIEGALIALAPVTDVEERPDGGTGGAMETFFAGWGGACLFAGGLAAGMVDATAVGAEAFPRFHTFWTIDFAEERKPKRDDLGFSGLKRR